MKLGSAGCIAAVVALSLAPAQAGTSTETMGTAVAVALPLVAGGVTLYKRDWTGAAELTVSTVLTVGTVYALKHIVKECRPFAVPCTHGGGNWDSMPSDTTALAVAPAEFLRERYGWQYGLPAYAAAGFVAWSRVDARKHHWYDTLASGGISLLYNEIITTRYHPNRGFYSNLDAQPDGVYASLGYRF
jgi:membrane-associated phospholipid phosphatase